MNLPDRLLCLLLGHTWEPATKTHAKRCPHCELEMTVFEVITYWRRTLQQFHGFNSWTNQPQFRPVGSDLPASVALNLGWPKRVWRVR